MNLKRIRLSLALCSLVVLTLLFLDFTGTLRVSFGWLAKLQFIPAVLAFNLVVLIGLIVLTLVFGRVYCSILCPLGLFQDSINRVSNWVKKRRFSYFQPSRWLRYGILVLFLSSLALGVGSVVQILEPYSAFGRMISNIFSYPYQGANNLLALLSLKMGNYWFFPHDIWICNFQALLLSILTLLIVGVFSWYQGRTYCNSICPVGTLLGLVSRFSILRPIIDLENCNHCGKCERSCKASCIHSKAQMIDHSRCVVCMNCLDACDKGAIRFELRKKENPTAEETAMNDKRELSSSHSARRAFLSLIGIFAFSNTLFGQKKNPEGGLAKIEDKVLPDRTTPISPPGSKGLKHFTHHCTACGLCIVNCPSQVLRPSSDWVNWMQPEMEFERGYCRPECTRCGEVCPTEAISEITKEQKVSTQIGYAVWLRDDCVVVKDGVDCGNCARHCPTGAIQMVEDRKQPSARGMIPAIEAERCIGCGACENLCPARPNSAIYIEGVERHHLI